MPGKHRPPYVPRSSRYVPPQEYSYSRVHRSRSIAVPRWVYALIAALVLVGAAAIMLLTERIAREADRADVPVTVWVTASTYGPPCPTGGAAC